MAIQYKTLPLGPLETNCYIVYDDVEKEAFLIDRHGIMSELIRLLTFSG